MDVKHVRLIFAAGLILVAIAFVINSKTTEAAVPNVPVWHQRTESTSHIGIGIGAKSYFETTTITVERRP